MLFTADPAPAFSRGTALMIALVAGVIVRPMPAPMTNICTSITHCGVVADTNA